VAVRLAGPKEYSALTDSAGRFQVDVVAGDYEVELRRPRFRPGQTAVLVGSGQQVAVEWTLRRPATVDLGWYVGPYDVDVDQVPNAVNTAVLYTLSNSCSDNATPPTNWDIRRQLAALPEGVKTWVEVPHRFHYQAYYDCRTGGGFTVTPDVLCGFRFTPHVTGDRATCGERYLAPIRDTLARVSAFDGAEKIHGWYAFDEPWNPQAGVKTEWSDWNVVREIVEFVRGADPRRRPVMGATDIAPIWGPAQYGTLPFWVGLTDVLGVDWYPKYPEGITEDFEPNTPPEPGLTGNWSWVTKATDAMAPFGATTYYIAQGQGPTSGREVHYSPGSTPSLREMRFSAWSALVRGTQGVLYWWWPFSDQDRGREGLTIRDAGHTVFREIKTLRIGRILFAGTASAAVSFAPAESRLALALRQYHRRWYLLVAGQPDWEGPVEFRLGVAPPPGACAAPWPHATVTEMLTRRSIPWSQQSCDGPVVFADRLEKGAVRAYRLFDPADAYLVGDWDRDDRANLAVRRGHHVLMDTNFDGGHDLDQGYGEGEGEDEYLVGDWDGDGRDNLAVRRGHHVLMDTNFDGGHDLDQGYGEGDDEDQYLVGDWDGDGRDNLAVRRGNRVLMDTNFDGGHDLDQRFGEGDDEDQYLVGDWDGDGRDNLAVRRGHCVLMDTDFDSAPDLVQCYGEGDAESDYLVGDWDGDDRDNLAVRRGHCVLMDTNFDGGHDRQQCYGDP
jgi:hypothetical protein